MTPIIFVRDHSAECDQAETLLDTFKVNYVTLVDDSEDGTPCLIVPDRSYSLNGLDEISEFAKIYSDYHSDSQ
jgi:hypothetical protein